MTQEEIKRRGQDATNLIWQTFKGRFQDPELQKAAFEACQIVWGVYKSRIQYMEDPAFWADTTIYWRLFEIVDQLAFAYQEIYQELWEVEYREKFHDTRRSLTISTER